MRQLSEVEGEGAGGGQPSLSNVVAAVGMGVAICTAPAWGAVGALIGLTAIMFRTLE